MGYLSDLPHAVQLEVVLRTITTRLQNVIWSCSNSSSMQKMQGFSLREISWTHIWPNKSRGTGVQIDTVVLGCSGQWGNGCKSRIHSLLYPAKMLHRVILYVNIMRTCPKWRSDVCGDSRKACLLWKSTQIHYRTTNVQTSNRNSPIMMALYEIQWSHVVTLPRGSRFWWHTQYCSRASGCDIFLGRPVLIPRPTWRFVLLPLVVSKTYIHSS